MSIRLLTVPMIASAVTFLAVYLVTGGVIAAFAVAVAVYVLIDEEISGD